MARYNTSLASKIITGTTTILTPDSGSFVQLAGTSGYTVTLPVPAAFPGQNFTFHNTTSGVVTISAPSGNFVGAGAPGTGSYVIPPTAVLSVTSDGANYTVISEDGSPLTATTGVFSSNVTMDGASATVNISPQTVTINPGSSGTIDRVSIGSTTRSSAAFTTLTANSATTLTANTASSNSSTGTLVVTGGIGVSGNLNSGGTVSAVGLTGPLTGTVQTAAQPNITSVGTLTGLTTNGLTVNGVASLNGRTTVKDTINADTSYPFGIQNGSQQQWWLRAGTTTNTFALHLNGSRDLIQVDTTGRVIIGGTNSNIAATDYAYMFDYEPTRNTWTTTASDGVRSHALVVRTPVLDSTNVDAIVIAESGGQATGRNSLTWWNEDFSSGTGYRKARMYTQVGGSYQSTAWYLDVADSARTLQTRISVSATGNIGINTSSPSHTLHVVNNNNSGNGAGGTVFLDRLNNASYENALNWGTNGTRQWFLGQDNDGTDDLLLYNWVSNQSIWKATSDGIIKGMHTDGSKAYTFVRLTTPRTWTATFTGQTAGSFTTTGTLSLPAGVKALSCVGYYHVTGYSSGWNDHALSQFGPRAQAGGTPWSFNTSTDTEWGSYTLEHDGDASGSPHYYGAWNGVGLINVGASDTVFYTLGRGHSGGTHYNSLWIWGYWI